MSKSVQVTIYSGELLSFVLSIGSETSPGAASEFLEGYLHFMQKLHELSAHTQGRPMLWYIHAQVHNIFSVMVGGSREFTQMQGVIHTTYTLTKSLVVYRG